MDNSNRLLDKALSKLFVGSNGAFYGSLICSADISFSEECQTAATDGLNIIINEQFFLKCSPEFRVFVLLHELRHIAYLHFPRQKGRDPAIWNQACDHVINHDNVSDGYKYDANVPFLMSPEYKGMLEEEIYDLLVQKSESESQPNIFEGDLSKSSSTGSIKEVTQQVVNAVAKAIQATKSIAGSIPGNVEDTFNRFVKSIVPWERVLFEYFTDLGETNRSWSRPNRRYEDVYLPSEVNQENRLQKINLYIDVSGSISNKQIDRFLTEMKYIKDSFNPEELRVVQFDTRIQVDQVFIDSDEISDVVIIGRGGTDLRCVKKHIEETKPNVAIVFSDLMCVPMNKPTTSVEVIWLILGKGYEPFFGKSITIEE